jgi:hypothetical protein
MQGVAFDPIVRLLDAGIGVVDRTHSDFVAAREAQAGADPVLELERRTQAIAFNLGILERRDADACLDIRLDRLTLVWNQLLLKSNCAPSR